MGLFNLKLWPTQESWDEQQSYNTNGIRDNLAGVFIELVNTQQFCEKSTPATENKTGPGAIVLMEMFFVDYHKKP